MPFLPFTLLEIQDLVVHKKNYKFILLQDFQHEKGIKKNIAVGKENIDTRLINYENRSSIAAVGTFMKSNSSFLLLEKNVSRKKNIHVSLLSITIIDIACS